jgi:hypothetical protein
VLILCTGMIRSASTWSFNVVKQLIARNPEPMTMVGGYADAIERAMLEHGGGADHLVLKCHNPDALGRAMIKQRLCRTIYTFREPLDVVVSAHSATDDHIEATTERIRASLDLLCFQIEAGGVRCLWYDDIVARPRDCVQAIADYLGLGLPAPAVDEVAERLSRDNVRRLIKAQAKSAPQTDRGDTQWDSGTLFHDHHIRDNPIDPAHVLSDAQVAAIAEQLGRDSVDHRAALHPGIREFGALAWSADGPRRVWPAPPVVDAPAAPAVAADAAMPAVAAAPVVDDAAPAADDAAPADPAPAPAEAPVAAAPPPPAATTGTPATPEAPPKHAAFDPAAEAERRALARQLLRTLRSPGAAQPRTGKSRPV